MTGGWSASGDRSGLWQSGGMASDGTSLFATMSNGGDATHRDSEEVTRISGMSGDNLVGIQLDMSTTPATPKIQWCAPVAGGEDRHHPISTSTDGVSNAIVWFVVGGGLKAFNGDTGASLFTSTPCGNVQKQT